MDRQLTNPFRDALGWSQLDLNLVYDALRFARDEFRDERGNSWSDEEYARLIEIIDEMDPWLFADLDR
jgi:hypothetical protein